MYKDLLKISENLFVSSALLKPRKGFAYIAVVQQQLTVLWGLIAQTCCTNVLRAQRCGCLNSGPALIRSDTDSAR